VIQYQVKLKFNGEQEAKLEEWLWRLQDCGGLHDRDINAAMNTLRVGVGATPQRGICNDA